MRLHVFAENFRSFPTIDWELPQGLTLIDGVNKDTGGSNMAGKTTLLDAWFWCRYGWLPKWKGPKGGQVDGVLRRRNNVVVGSTLVRVTEQFGPDTITIERRRPTRLRVCKNGIEIPGLDQKGLEAILGMSAERFLVCVYLPQRRQRSFYWMGDNERMDLLSVVANLEAIERSYEDAKLMRDEAEEELDRGKTKIDILDAQVKELPVKISEYETKKSHAESQLKVAREEAHKAEMRLDEYNYDVETKATEEVKDKIDPLVDQVADYQTQIKVVQNQIQMYRGQMAEIPQIEPHYDQKVQQLRAKLRDVQKLQDERNKILMQIESEIKAALASDNGTCSACNQMLPEAVRQRKKALHQSEIDRLQARITQTAGMDVEVLSKELQEAQAEFYKRQAELEAEPARLRGLISGLQDRMDKIRAEERAVQREIQDTKNAEIRKWKDKQDEFRRAVEKAYSEVAHLEKALKTASEIYDSTVQQEVSLRAQITSLENEIADHRQKHQEALDLVEIFGPKGYRAVCFDGLIEKISDRAGQLLSVMTDSLYSTRLEQVGQDSKGNQKLILKPVIIKNSSEVPLDDLSGGAEERVALAYDVAVAEAAGEGMPLLLDEVLSALDAVGKNEAMALLEEVSKARPVLVVDHASEFKAMFSQVVRVIYENEESRLDTA